MISKLIILLVIVLGAIAIAQLIRVYELSSRLRKTGEHEISNRDNRLNGNLMMIFMIALYVGFIWLMLKYGWTGRGDAASVHGHEVDWLMNLNFIIIIAVFFLTNTLLFYFAYKYVRKQGVAAFYFPHNNKLELVWTVIPAIVLAVLIVFGLQKWNNITSAASEDAIRVELFSKQFDWTARYSGEDNLLGKFDYKLTTDANELGIMTAAMIDSAIFNMENGVSGINMLTKKLNDPNLMMVPKDKEAMMRDLNVKERLVRSLYQLRERYDSKLDAMALDDIIQKDTLYLCVNKPYEFNFRAKDVIHSAHFPHFRAQMNTVPGLVTRFKFTPDLTSKQMRKKMKNNAFNYVLLCNKVCGGAHYKVKMMVVVLSESEYADWLDSKKGKTFGDGLTREVEGADEPMNEDKIPSDTIPVIEKN